jgi:uncharacterized protein involved in type VI secretion and phage assembly
LNLFNVLVDRESKDAIAGRIYGAVIGIVTNNEDPEGLGRVKVKFPWLSADEESTWARLATLMAGNERGIYFLPEVDDEVLVIFEQGDVRFPYIIGALWNGKDKPPTTNADGNNNIREIVSRSGHVIRLNDEEGKETIEIIDKSEKNHIIFDTANNAISVTADQTISLKSPQGSIQLEAKTIEIKSTSETKLEAGAGMNLEAKATMNIKGQTINLN